MSDPLRAMVAGHICLDIIPDLTDHQEKNIFTLFKPGRLVQVGGLQFSCGGAVSNTGLALNFLGVPTRLVAKLGNDPMGKILIDLITERNPDLVSDLIIDPGEMTSYSIILSNQYSDRLFLHCTGANDSFSANDLIEDQLIKADLFHLGYPPALKQMYIEKGKELRRIFQIAKRFDLTTSLDMSLPDPGSESGKVDWPEIFKASLPYIDIFLPSIDELLFTLRKDQYFRYFSEDFPEDIVNGNLLSELSTELLNMGVKIVVIKLGSRGLYVRTSSSNELAKMGKAKPIDLQAWADRERWIPSFDVEVVGTTGAGDTTIAGFLSGLLHRQTLDQTLAMAVAVGACNVEAPDSLSGLRSWELTQQRILSGWNQAIFEIKSLDWVWHPDKKIWIGPHETIKEEN